MILLLCCFFMNPFVPSVKVTQDLDFQGSRFTWDWVGPEGGELNSIICDPQNQNLAFAFSMFDLWRTTDGVNWSVVPQFLYEQPQFGTFIRLNRALVTPGDSMYLTTDGGNNWSLVNYDFGDYIVAMTKEPGETVLVVGETPDGYAIHRTTDGGGSFDSLAEITGYSYVSAITADNDSTIFLGTIYPGATQDTGMILRSTDLGQNWTVVLKASDTLDFAGVADIELNPANPREIFVCLGMDGGPVGVLYSSDNGNNWTSFGTQDGLFLPNDVEFLSNDSIIVASIFRHGIFSGSRSAGWNFSRVDSTYGSSGIGGGVGATWYSSTYGGVLKSTDNGMTWFDRSTDLKAVMTWFGYDNFTPPINGTMYITSVMGNAFYRSTDGGATWAKKPDGNIIWRPAIEAFPSNPSLVYASGMWVDVVGIDTIAYDFLKSTNGGADWDTVHQAPHPDSAVIFSSLHVFPTDQNRLLGYHMAHDPDSEAVFLTTDQGKTWTVVLADCDGPIVGSDTVFVFNDNQVLYSTDLGLSWNTLTTGFSAITYDYDPDDQFLYIIKDVAPEPDSLIRVHLDGTIENLYPIDGYNPLVDVHGSKYIFISLIGSTFPELLRSSDAGTTFVIDTLGFYPMGIAVSPNEILLADLGKSFWRSTDAIGVAEGKTRRLQPKTNVYPSVFRRQLNFETTGPLPISVGIYDVAGRMIDSFIIAKKVKVWRKSIPAGIYFYELNSKNKRSCGKVVKID